MAQTERTAAVKAIRNNLTTITAYFLFFGLSLSLSLSSVCQLNKRFCIGQPKAVASAPSGLVDTSDCRPRSMLVGIYYSRPHHLDQPRPKVNTIQLFFSFLPFSLYYSSWIDAIRFLISKCLYARPDVMLIKPLPPHPPPRFNLYYS